MFVFVLASGFAARAHALGRRLASATRSLRRRAESDEGRRSTSSSRRCCWSSRGSRRCACATTSAASPTTAARTARTSRSAAERLPRRRVDADAAARSRGRADALVPLLRLRLPVHRHGDQRDRPPAPRPLKFLHGNTYQAYSAGADLAGVLFLIGIGWAIVRRYVAAPVSHPHQDQARRRAHPGHVPRDRAHRLLRRRRCASRSSTSRCSRSGRSSAIRLSGSIDTWSRQHAAERAPVVVGHPRRRVPRVPRDPAHDEAAPHVHVTHEHVHEGSRPPQGRDEADAEPHGDRARELRCGEDRRLHVEAAARHRRVHGVRTLHVGVPRARDRQAARPA